MDKQEIPVFAGEPASQSRPATSRKPTDIARKPVLSSPQLGTQFHNREPIGCPYQQRIVVLQLVTMAWMCLEAGVAIFGALGAHSVALLGFGADSAIELVSASVVFLEFAKRPRDSENNAARVAGWLLLLLAALIVGDATIALTNPRFRPQPSYVGISLLIAAGLAMPWLARQKQALAAKIRSRALKADAVQSAMCGYLAWIALAGLVLNAVFRLSFADPIAALLLLPIIVREGWEAIQDERSSGATGRASGPR